jgi:hypothetical protein
MSDLLTAGLYGDGIGRTDRNAGAASSACLRIEFGNERPAEPRPKPDRASRTAVAARLTVDVIIGQAPIADCRIMGKAACRTGRKDILGTSFRALAAKGAFTVPEVHDRNARTDRNDLRRTGIDAGTAARTVLNRCLSGSGRKYPPGREDPALIFR